MKISLIRAITGVTILASLLSLTAISCYSYYSSRRALLANAHTIMEAHTRNVEQQTRLLLEPVPRLAAAMVEVAQHGGNLLEQEQTTYRFLVEKLKDLPTIYSVYWADTNGQFLLVGRRPMKDAPGQTAYFLRSVRIGNGQRKVTETWFNADGNRIIAVDELASDNYDPRLRPWYQAATRVGAPAWTEPYVFYITGNPGITYAVPLYREGKLLAVCAVDLETESLSHYLQQILPTPRSRIFVVDSSFRIVGYSDSSKLLSREAPGKAGNFTPEQLGDDVVVKTCQLPEQQVAGDRFRSGVVVAGGETFHSQMKSVSVLGFPLGIGLAIPDGELFAPLVHSQGAILIFSLTIMFCFAAAGLFFARAVARPMEKLRQAAMQIADRKFEENLLVETRFEEIHIIFAAFRRMQESIRGHLEKTRGLNETLQGAHLESLYRLALAAEFKDRDTAIHLYRVAHYSRELARLGGVTEEDAETLFHASLMHDVGKIGIADDLLLKPGQYTDEERQAMQEHTLIGGKILAEPTSKEMKMAYAVALSHHEKWDGTGYPSALKGEDIPLWGRIVALADVLDSLLSQRTYKEPMDFDQALQYIRSSAGRHFDPALADLVLKNPAIFKEITFKYTSSTVYPQKLVGN